MCWFLLYNMTMSKDTTLFALVLVIYYILPLNLVNTYCFNLKLIKKNFVSDLRQVSSFLWALVSSTNKTDRHNITEIFLNVTLKTIIPL